ncbi:MAG TPA: phosphatidylserine decarboxylase [bacterium]|nr:phosphatidylserine decarboxylase [bacterium]HPQ65793.1 phosphatidylserine decarboxylase [bacterium]
MKYRIDREAYRFDAVLGGLALVFAVLALVLCSWLWVFTGVFLALLLGVTAFLRESNRDVAFTSGEIVSPATGKVIVVREEEETEFVGGSAKMVSIFMSVTDEHINYAPVSGKVGFLRHRRGGFHRAYLEDAFELNEAQLIGIEAEGAKVLVKQVAGIIARRIVCRCRPGQVVEAGEKIGLIRFGSRVDLYLPPRSMLTVEPGSKVAGGITVIGRLP